MCHGEILLGTPTVQRPEAGLQGGGHPPGLLSKHTASVLVGTIWMCRRSCSVSSLEIVQGLASLLSAVTSY